MKQSNLAEKIIVMSVEGIYMGISSAIWAFISLILSLLFPINTFTDCGQSKNVSLPVMKETGFDNSKLADAEVTSKREKNVRILFSNVEAVFREAKGSPLFGGLLPNDISILCRYWYSNKFDCIIVL